YEKNLTDLVRRMKETGAKLVWACTTPVPEKIEGGGPERRNEDAVAYNAAARKIMESQGVVINDLYAVALPRLKEIQIPFDVHFTFEGSEILAKEIARVILTSLKSSAEHRQAE